MKSLSGFKTIGAFLIIPIIGFETSILKAQPYLDTHVENPFFKENTFVNKEVDSVSPPLFQSIRQDLPIPFWTENKAAIDCYWYAWETAFSNLKSPGRANGFVSPYIDPAFNNNIFMWDCSFMTMFGKYARQCFNFQLTLDNFYAKQHKDGFICREIRGSDGTDVFERFDPSGTGPNIMPWAEWEYYLNYSDLERLKEVFPVLLGYYHWYSTYRRWQDGTYFSSGWGSGMDNQPRLPKIYHNGWSHGYMSWIDISLQEVLSGKILVQMAEELGRGQEVADIKLMVDNLEHLINQTMWNNDEGYYFDKFSNGSLSNVKSIASYWALISRAVPGNRLERFVGHLDDTGEFARIHRVPTLSADQEEYNPVGDYWNGSVWAPTNYMVLRGLTEYGLDSLAHEIAINHLQNVVDVFRQTNELWENYAPDTVKGNDRKQFVGWTGLVPISVLFEYVFGIRPNMPENTLVLDIRLNDNYGVSQYPFGDNGLLDISVSKQENSNLRPTVKIASNVSFKLCLKWGNSQEVIKIKKGKTTI